jgi:hypothetical protein
VQLTIFYLYFSKVQNSGKQVMVQLSIAAVHVNGPVRIVQRWKVINY